MNDERPIEKLLRRHAKQRRDAAEARGVEMHPATRRLLQGEVARKYPQGRAGKAGLFSKIFSSSVGRLAYAASGLAVMALLVFMFVPAMTRNKHAEELASKERDMELAKADSAMMPQSIGANSPVESIAPTPTAAPLSDQFVSVLALEPESPAAPASTAPGRDATVSGGAITTATPGNREARGAVAVLSESAGKKSTDTLAMDKIEIGFAGGVRDEVVARRMASPMASATTTARYAAVAPPGAATGGGRGGGGGVPTQLNSQAFSNIGVVQQRPQKITAQSASPVLANFRIEQNGDQVSVVDADGSTYSAALVVAEEMKRADASKQVAFEKSKVQIAGKVAQQQAQQYAWRAVGTNRTLNQRVEFNWNYIAATNLPAESQNLAAGNDRMFFKDAANSQQQQSPAFLQNSAINGRARLDARQEIEINALPVAP